MDNPTLSAAPNDHSAVKFDQGAARAFTLIFSGDIRNFKSNPFTANTPFGVAYAAGVGDAFERCDILRDALHLACDHVPAYIEEKLRVAIAKADFLR